MPARAAMWGARPAVFLALPMLAACTGGVLDPHGPVGAADGTILIDSLVIMLAIVVPTIAATFRFAWWFRASNRRARYRPNFVYSGQVELLVWGIPALTIILLGGVAWIGSHALDPAKPLPSKVPPLEIQGVSLDWKWLFIYPGQHVAALNQLVIPAGTPIRFMLSSASVMNAFFVPQLGSMIYTMNGMTTQLNLMSDRPGEFRGMSSHFSGDGFADMHFQVRALPPDKFVQWVSATQKAGPALDEAAYHALSEQRANVPPMTYRTVADGLFQDIVTQKLPPGTGPAGGAPAP